MSIDVDAEIFPAASSASFRGYVLPDNNPDTMRCDYSESLSSGLLLLYTCVTYCLIFRVLHLFGAKEYGDSMVGSFTEK